MSSAQSEATAGVEPDMYGQYHPIETDELIERKIKEFDDEVDGKIPDEKKAGVLKAQKHCPELLTSDFKLMFLRSEVFNADLAAKRYCTYWERRIEIFGEDRAFKPLTVENVFRTDEDRACYEMGVINLFKPSDDQRMVLFLLGSRFDKSRYTIDGFLRCKWYFVHAALEDEVTQKKGLVIMPYGKDLKMDQFNKSLMQKVIEGMRGALPMRFSAEHICHPPVFFSVVWPVVSLFMSALMKKRVKLHRGNQQKILDRLSQYGFTKESLPTELGGDLVLDPIQWIESRKKDNL